jgi:long-chain acyl-CoA synthetase
MVRGYEEDASSRAEKIEALIYPNEEFFKTAGNDGGPASEEDITRRVNEIVSEVNQRLLPYQRISKVTLLEEPLEMTTTKKIKRHSVDK